jgi:Dockerin type I domain
MLTHVRNWIKKLGETPRQQSVAANRRPPMKPSLEILEDRLTPTAALLSITNVVINGDIPALYNAAGQPSPGVQRSMVNDIVYTFNDYVTMPSDGSAFTINIASGWSGSLPTSHPATGVPGTQDASPYQNYYSSWAISFSGNGVTGGSIANGCYTISVTNPVAITDPSGYALSLAGSGIGSATQSFYRLFGDINGDQLVNAADNLRFKQALTVYNAAFDYNADGSVNAADNLHFKADIPVNFIGFTPTI